MFTLIIGILAFVVGLYIGRENLKEASFKNDPDNDPKLSKDDFAMLLFTKQSRYEYGRMYVIGDKEEQKKAKERLDKNISAVLDAKFNSERS